MALVSAVATLLAALFICFAPAGVQHLDEAPAGPRSASLAGSAGTDTAEYSCPYDNSGCGLFPHLNPAVLTVPPPAGPLVDDGRPPHLELPNSSGQVPPSGALPRAPDLHVLQVLRT